MRREFTAGPGPTEVADGPLVSVVVPCLNEQEVLCETNRRLCAVLGQMGPKFEIVYVDDGSTDSTPEILRQMAARDERIRVVRFSRNFGHQMAITAGLEHASGDAVVVIDADLQDPPEVILQLVDKWMEGYDVAYGVRAERDGETAFKLWTAKTFYRFINRLSETPIPLDTGDFRLMDRRVVQALLEMPERDRFVRGMVSWLGFSQIAVPYRERRALRAQRNFRFSKCCALPWTAFSRFPSFRCAWRRGRDLRRRASPLQACLLR